MPLWLAALVSAAGAGLAWRVGTLTTGGGLAAWTAASSILHGSGWAGGAVLAAFFVSSNLISRLCSPAKVWSGLDPKGDRRDLWQVYANGGPAAAGAALASDPLLALWLVTASLAAAASDTWATSTGARSRISPRLLWSWRPVPHGTSGGVTLLGSAGGLAGALVVAATGALAGGVPLLLITGTLIGFAGMALDSLLGGLVQGRFHCPQCDVASEWRIHRCGSLTVSTAGLAWLNNDGVNFLATGFAACAALAMWYLLYPSR